MVFKKIVILFVLLLSLVIAYGSNDLNEKLYSNSNFEKSIQSDIDNIISNYLSKNDYPIIDVIIESQGEYYITKNTSENLNSKVGSLSKLYTAILIMKLYELKLIDLEENLSKYFPDYKHSGEIKIKHLLSHRSGIRNFTEKFSTMLFVALRKNKEYDNDYGYRKIRKKNLLFTPGTDYYYSNSNYIMLGLIAEKATGNNIDFLFDKYINKPLKLKNTFMYPSGYEKQLVVDGVDYDLYPFGKKNISYEDKNWSSVGFTSGALISNAKELNTIIKNLFSGKIINYNILNQMISYNKAFEEDNDYQKGYGYGVRVFNINGNLYYGHTGTIPGYGALSFYNEEKNLAVSITSNRSWSNLSPLLESIDSLFE